MRDAGKSDPWLWACGIRVLLLQCTSSCNIFISFVFSCKMQKIVKPFDIQEVFNILIRSSSESGIKAIALHRISCNAT